MPNYFAMPDVGARYAARRPYVHPDILAHVQARLGLTELLARGLDVGCGTGQSTLALTTVARQVVGLDPSPEMIRHTPQGPGLTYVQGLAEQLSFATASFDVVTVALAFHWLDRARFLPDARRVLRPGGHLVIYNNRFDAHKAENEAFAAWHGRVYRTRYPSPPRNRQPLTDDEASAAGFDVLFRDELSHWITFDIEGLAEYLMTHSNIIQAVAEGRDTYDNIRDWLVTQLTPLFPAPTATFLFTSYVWCLQRREAATTMTQAEAFLDAIKTGDRAKVEQMLIAEPDLARATTASGLSVVLLAAYYQEPAIAARLAAERSDLTIFEAAAVGHERRVEAFLDSDSAQLDAVAGDGFTPLGLASFFGQPEVVELLLAHGANVNLASQNAMRVAPLHSAVAQRRIDIARQLIAHGADVNARQADDFTPLHGAAQNGQAEMVALLLQHGADMNARPRDGQTALTLARATQAADAIALLEAAGAIE